MTAATPGAPTDPRPRGTWRYRPELDGLRSFAVVVIVFFHARVTGAASSFIVLDLFFVLSGFLVTNVVLSEVDATGTLRLGRYYARRVRRLLPAAVVTIVVTSVVFVMIASQPERLALVRQAQAALVYLANWQFIADGADYFAGDIRDSPFMHFWSLSIEEQYYIVFPLLILAWWKLAPGRARVLLGALVAIAGLSIASQLYWAQVDPTRAYFATDARLFQLMAGAALAVAVREFATAHPDGGVVWPRAGAVLAAAGLLGYVVFGTELVEMTVSHRNLLATVLAGALVLGTYTAPRSWVARAFALPWMVYLGGISYGIYLWHYPVLLVLDRVFTARPLVIAVMGLALAVALASMSHQLVESPIRTGRLLNPFSWPTVAAGVAVSVLAAAFVVPPILQSPRPPSVVQASDTTAVDAAEAAADGSRVQRRLAGRVPDDLDFRAVAADRGPDDTWCRPSAPEDCLVVDGDGPHVVLVGDSHARMLADAFVALAEDKGFKLSMSIVAACPWGDGLLNTQASAEVADRCRDARSGFYDRALPRMDADVVVLANLARTDPDLWDGSIERHDGGPAAPLHEMQRDAVARTVDKITDAGARAVIVKSILGTGGWDDGPDPLDCLARAERLRECVVTPPIDRPVADSMYEVAAIGDPDVATVDLNPVFCPDAPACAPVLDGVVVWRDPRHVSGEVAVEHRQEIWAAVRRTGSP